MDVRERTFTSEVRARLDYLLDAGFIRSEGEVGDRGRRPRSLTVTYQSERARVEVSLALGFMGEEAVHTRIDSVNGTHEIGPTTAHKGHEMQKALDTHARDIRTLVSSLPA